MDEPDVVIDMKQNDPDRRKTKDLIPAGQNIPPGKLTDSVSLLLINQLYVSSRMKRLQSSTLSSFCSLSCVLDTFWV